MKPVITVVIADDHPIFRAGLRQILEPTPRCMSPPRRATARRRWPRSRRSGRTWPSSIIDMPGRDGFDVTHTLRGRSSPTRVILLTLHVDAPVLEKVFPALDANVNSRIRMLWITCGTADSLVGVNRDVKEWLRAKGVRFTEEEAPDVGHVWPYWRKNFAELATKAFQGSTSRR